jgi:pyruvate/2-oxoglutarate dehydrogenase complex dihydrolipoamide acyltransferase (E2) component
VFATPMLNPPEAAIVALGRVRPLPRYDAATGELARRHVMGFALGADHRVVDGAAVAGFANTFKALMEDPARLLLHLR